MEGQYSILAPQRDVLASEADIVMAIAGVRAGKTDVGGLRTLQRAMQEPTEADQCHAVVSPTFPMSKQGPEAKLHKLLHNRSLFPQTPLIEFKKSERCFYVRNRAGTSSRIRIFSGDDPDKWRGDAWLSAWLDEAAFLDAYAWDIAQGRLSDNGGPALFTTTPNGHNFVFDLASEATIDIPRAGYVVRVSPSRDVVVVSWSSLANKFLTKSRFDRLERRYDPDAYAQEVLAQFIAKSGRVYKSFERTKHVAKIPRMVGATVHLGLDFNVGRMFGVLTQRVKYRNGQEGMHAFAELEVRDADTYKYIARLRDMCARIGVRWDAIEVNPDASSRKRSTTGTDTAKSDLEILRRHGLRIRGPRANPHVKDRVNCVNGLFYNARASVSPECPLLIESLEKQVWDEDGKPEKDGEHDNRNDAWGYTCWANFPLRGARAVFGNERKAV